MKISNVQQVNNNSIGAKITDNCETIAYLNFNNKFEKDGEVFYKLSIASVVDNETLDPFTYRSDYEELMRNFYYHLDLVDSLLNIIPNTELMLNDDQTVYTTPNEEDCFELYDERGYFKKYFAAWIKADEYLFENLQVMGIIKQKTLENTNN